MKIADKVFLLFMVKKNEPVMVWINIPTVNNTSVIKSK